MVRLIVPVIGAVAALSSSSLAAPMMKRSTPPSYEYTTPEYQESSYESSYDVESSSYVESSNVESSSTYVVESSSTYSVPESTPVYESSVPVTYEGSSTTEYVPSESTYVPEPESTYSVPEYGSGWNDWGSSYDDCVQKCVAHYGAPESHEWTPEQPTESKDPSTGGAVHTVLVAPVDGVPRFMPFALNATVGDTVRFVWPGTATHSVTMSSELNLCSKSEATNAFDSGLLSGENGEQTFDVTIDSDETKYFYCAAAEGAHCAQGMWGMINPKSAAGQPNTIGGKMNEWVEANPDLKAVWSVVHNSTKDTPADTWGNSISLDGVPEDQYVNIAENVLWNRANFAANPGMQEAGQGASTPDGSPLTLVGDISTLLSANSEPANAAPAPPATETPASSSALPRGVVSGAFVTAVTLLASVFVL